MQRLPHGTARAALAAILATTGAVGCANHIGTTAASFLQRVEESPDPNIRHLAYRKLASARCYDSEEQKGRAATLLAAKLTEGKEPVASRAAICQTLGALERPEGREALLRAINDPEPLIRAQACRALGKIGTPEDAAQLTRIVAADNELDCRIAAIEGLGDLKSQDPRVGQLLVENMENQDPAVRLVALRSLRATTGEDLGADPKPWREMMARRLAATDHAADAETARR